MIRRPHFFFALAAILLALFAAPSARSQVVVYSVDFKHEDGFNIDFFDGGYFVAPALGGSGTFILTAHENGTKTLSSPAGTGNFFHGIDEHEQRKSVVSATGGDGSTSVASYVAFGDVTSSIEIKRTDATYKLKIAKKLKGGAIAASSAENTITTTSSSSTDTTTGTTTTTTTTDTTGTGSTTDTSTGTTTVSDGTVGFANVSSMTLTYDEGHTKQSNELDQSVEQAVASLTLELQQKGYLSSSTSSSSGGSSSSSSSSSGTTTASPEIGVSVSNAGGVGDGGSASFGSVAVGGSSSLTFTISNTGGADLTGLTATLDGADAGEFSVTATATSPVTGPTGTTALTVQFAPTVAGSKTAALHIASNDSDESSYDITLSATGT